MLGGTRGEGGGAGRMECLGRRDGRSAVAKGRWICGRATQGLLCYTYNPLADRNQERLRLCSQVATRGEGTSTVQARTGNTAGIPSEGQGTSGTFAYINEKVDYCLCSPFVGALGPPDYTIVCTVHVTRV